MAIASGQGGRLRTLLREPLLQFALVGLALFAVQRLWGARGGPEDARIVLDAPVVAHQQQLYAVQFGAPPDALTLQALLDRHVREEALYREGLRLRLDTGDEVIRQRVVQKMETLLADAEVVPEPTAAQLQAFHAAHAARYTEPGTVSLRQLYFATDTGGDAGAQARARAALAVLQRDPQARIRADALAIGEYFTALDAPELTRRFGVSPFADAAGQAPVGRWSGPYASGFGWHLLLVTARSAPRVAPLDAVRDRVRADYLAAARETAREQRIAEVVSRFEVVRPDAR